VSTELHMTPPLGKERAAMDQTCGFGADSPQCSKPATWHVVWTADLDNSVCCDEHMDYANAFAYYDRHPITDLCTFPAAVLVWSWDEPPGRCVWQVDDETMALATAAELTPVPHKVGGNG
jgi:hypothetical protein